VNSYTGATTVNAGTLVLNMTGGALNSSSALSLGGGEFQSARGYGRQLARPWVICPLTAGTTSTIALSDNGGANATTLVLGSTWTRGASSTLTIDYTNASNVGSFITSASAPTGAAGANNVLAFALVTDSTGTGLAHWTTGSNSITRLNQFHHLADRQ